MLRKEEIRQQIKRRKRQFTEEQLRELSLAIIDRLLGHPRIKKAKRILMYYSLPDEVYTHEAIIQLVNEGKEVFLPVVLDNFERGLKAIETVEDCDKVKECYNLAYKNFTDVLTKAGLEPIKAEGEMFDPNYHEAVMQTPTSEHKEHTVIEELQKGYKMGDRVLRPTLVNVATSAG